MKKLLTDAERLRHMYQHPDSWPRLAFLCVKNIHQRDELYCGPVLRHSAEPIQAANFRSAVAF